MYPLQCHGGYPVPAVVGKFEIREVSATIDDPSQPARVVLIDDWDIDDKKDKMGTILGDITEKRVIVCDIKKMGDEGAILSRKFAASVKTRKGLNIYYENIVPGTFCVYVN